MADYSADDMKQLGDAMLCSFRLVSRMKELTSSIGHLVGPDTIETAIGKIDVTATTQKARSAGDGLLDLVRDEESTSEKNREAIRILELYREIAPAAGVIADEVYAYYPGLKPEKDKTE